MKKNPTLSPVGGNDNNGIAQVLRTIGIIIWCLGALFSLIIMGQGCSESSKYYNSDAVAVSGVVGGLTILIMAFLSGTTFYALGEIIRLLHRISTTHYEIVDLDGFIASAPSSSGASSASSYSPAPSGGGYYETPKPLTPPPSSGYPRMTSGGSGSSDSPVVFDYTPAPGTEIYCPICGRSQRAPRSVCFSCGVPFVYKDSMR